MTQKKHITFTLALIAGLTGNAYALSPELAMPKLGNARPATAQEKISEQVAVCWQVPPEKKKGMTKDVYVNAELDPQGNISNISLNDKSLNDYKTDQAFREFSVVVILALKACSPLKDLPPVDYDQWKRITLKYDMSTPNQ